MKTLLMLLVVVGVTSCNTSIGIYRDTKAGFLWTQGKIQGMSSGGSGSGSDGGGGVVGVGGGSEQQEEYGAPVY